MADALMLILPTGLLYVIRFSKEPEGLCLINPRLISFQI